MRAHGASGLRARRARAARRRRSRSASAARRSRDGVALGNPAIDLFLRHGFTEGWLSDEFVMLRRDLQVGPATQASHSRVRANLRRNGMGDAPSAWAPSAKGVPPRRGVVGGARDAGGHPFALTGQYDEGERAMGGASSGLVSARSVGTAGVLDGQIHGAA